MARSRDVWGPYEPCPENPILVPASKDMYIRHTDHCDVFEDENGRWWGVLLGVRRDKDGRYNMGRESHLTPAKWTDDWLRLESVEAEINTSRLASANAVQGLRAVQAADFLYIRDPVLENYKIYTVSNTISVTSSSIDLSHPQESPSFVGRRQRLHAGQSSATFKINASSKLKTRLAVYKDEHRYLRVFYDTAGRAVVYEFVNNAKVLKKTEKRVLDRDVDTIQFRFEYTEQEYRVFYSTGTDWEHIATLDTLDMTGPDFVGPVIGVFALAQESVTVEVVDLQSNWSRRLPSLLQSICSAIILIGIFWMPESPRWLLSKDKHDEALKVLTHYHAEDDPDDEFVQLEFSEIKAAIALDKEVGQTAWVDFLKTPGNRKRIGLITAPGFFSQWSGNGLISYYLKGIMDNVGITKAETQLGINAGMKTQGLIINTAFAFFIDIFGRRPIYLTSTIGTCVIFTFWTIVSARYDIDPNKALGYAFVALTFIYGLFYDIKSGLMANYTTEIVPYGLRAKGFTWLNFCVTAALFFNQYINGIALEAMGWKYYTIYCLFLSFEVYVIYFFLIETRYTPMEEIAKYFDGDAVDVGEVARADMKERGVMMTEVDSKGPCATEIETR
ncbi:hypothetical protein H9Q70_013444 [Fusarium xylarioides]|nr:hypothetical protein H9Q70_013444 [Fusarium xylarioides]KAG5768022.1 hypothetical protein H9Q73_013991 [Fusarium xylarioides]